MIRMISAGSLCLLSTVCAPVSNGQDADPFLWLEEIDSERAMEWVESNNQRTIDALDDHPLYDELYDSILEILDSSERIPSPAIRGDVVYNFWQDDEHERGIWRRTTLEDYLNDEPEWETVLDIDALAKAEGEPWVFKGATFLPPEYDVCLVRLSRGGSDAVETREFDPQSKTFIEDGFFMPEAKGRASWIDRDTLLVSTDFGEGSLTASGYARIVKRWTRGTPLSEAETVFEGETNDVASGGFVIHTPERTYVGVSRRVTFYTSKTCLIEDGELIEIEKPDDAEFAGFFKNQMLIELKSDWAVGDRFYAQGSLLAIDYDDYLGGARDYDVLFKPEERVSLRGVASTRDQLILSLMNNVKSELSIRLFEDGEWKRASFDAPPLGNIGIQSTDDYSNRFFYRFENFVTPDTLYYFDGDESQVAKRMPAYFDSEKLLVEQHEAESSDGVMIPYFLVRHKDALLDGSNPTLLYAYGGFQIPLLPSYSPVLGSSWLERGGVYALANIRGGGEFGPKWHQAGLKEKRQQVYDDFYAVSEDLIERKITSPDHLGIQGGSNGGLLVGVAFTQRPDLYNAVICSVPLLDMKRFNQLLAGASWMGEYGNPDLPEEWEFISKYSPYQNLSESNDYPKVLFTTTTRDDRVHPGHARKMAAKMESQGHEFYYFENTEGGHGSGVTNKQRALMTALQYAYLHSMLK